MCSEVKLICLFYFRLSSRGGGETRVVVCRIL